MKTLLTYLLGAALVGAILTNCATHNRLQAERLAHQTSKAESAELRERQTEVARLAGAAFRAAERHHTDQIAAITQRSTHEKQALADAVARLSRSLQNRPDRPTTGGGAVPESPSCPVACTGAQLYRPDAAFLVREAARADALRLELAECQARYDAAHEALSVDPSKF